jgi:tetratricopeptide (TPR) repeat protein
MRFSTHIVPRLLLALLVSLAHTTLAGPIDAGNQNLTGVEASADTPQAREHRAGIQAQINGNLTAAKERYEAALKIDARFAPAWIGLAAVAQAQGSLAQAEQHLQQAERVAPKAPEVHLAWGRYFLSKGERSRAEKAFRTAHDLAPGLISPLLELGDIYLRLSGRSADAVTAYRAAVAIDNNNPFAQYGLGVALASVGPRAEALAALNRAAELAPRDPEPLRAIGRLHLEAGEIDEALAAFDAALIREPASVPLMLDRVDALGRAARWEEAFQQIQSAEALAPRSAEVKIRLGDVHLGAARWDEAEKSYLQAIEIAPENPVSYNNLAWMTVERKGDARKAVEWAHQAVKLSPGSSPFHDTLGWAERAAGNLPGALVSLKRAIELEPDVAAYHFHLGVVQSELNRSNEARVALKRALELDARLPQAEEARRRLKTLSAR